MWINKMAEELPDVTQKSVDLYMKCYDNQWPHVCEVDMMRWFASSRRIPVGSANAANLKQPSQYHIFHESNDFPEWAGRSWRIVRRSCGQETRRRGFRATRQQTVSSTSSLHLRQHYAPVSYPFPEASH